MASRHAIIKQIEELIADYEKELAKTDKSNSIAITHLKQEIKNFKQAIGLIK